MTSPFRRAVLCWGRHQVQVLGYHTTAEGKQTADIRYRIAGNEWYNTQTDRYEVPPWEKIEWVPVTLRGVPTEDLVIRVW